MLKPKPTNGDSVWFTRDRFGLFIHWGLYALPARHEWIKNYEEISDTDYQKYFEHFNPTLYDPRAWARAAKAAGMKYAVLTSKHHEGFCLWDTQHTDYKVTNTPYGKDLIGPYIEAFRAEGMKVGFYYSLLDWHHPDFTIDSQHPQRNHPDIAALNQGRDMKRYAAYMRAQARELLTNYGQIDMMFYDFSYPDRVYRGIPGKGRADWESDQLYALTRELQPNILINNRLDLPKAFVDYYTPEQIQPTKWYEVEDEPVVWETCQTFSGSWGYHRDEDTWKSPGQLIRMLVNTVACGGNLLMNVGPTSRGTLDRRALDALAVYGDWIRLNGDSIYGCTQSAFTPPPDCRFTQNGSKLYLHVFAWPFKYLFIEGIADSVEYVQFLHDGSEIEFKGVEAWQADHVQLPENTLTLTLPIKKPDVVVPVIEITLKA